MVKEVLFDGSSASSWYTAEATIESAEKPSHSGSPTIHWHVTVDHTAGEAKYPIGWPRVGSRIDEAQRDWSDSDFFQFWMYSTTSRAAFPKTPAGLTINQTEEKTGAYNLSLTDLKKDEWVEVRVPISRLSHPDDVRGIQLNIAESDYQHGDKIEFFIDQLALLRYSAPTFLNFTATEAVHYSDTKYVSASFILSGIRKEESKSVTMELKKDEKVVISKAFTVSRGAHRLLLPLEKGDLEPGVYQVIGLVEGGESVTSTVRIVESPWK